MKYAGTAAALLIAAAGCRFVESRTSLRDCKFDLADVVVKDITLTHAELAIKVKVENPNDVEVIVDRFEYRLFSNKDLLGEGEHLHEERVPPGASREVTITMTTPLKNLGRGVLTQLRDRGNVTYTLVGTAHLNTFLGEIKVPVELRKKY